MQLDVNFISRGHCLNLKKLCDGSEDDDVKRTSTKGLLIMTLGQEGELWRACIFYGIVVPWVALWCHLLMS